MGGSGSPVQTRTVSSSDSHDDERANRVRQMMKRVQDVGKATNGKVDYNAFELSWILLSDPSSRMRRAWDVMMVGLLVYTAIYVPYQIAFLSSDLEPIRDDGLFAWGIIVDTIFMTDMLLALVTGYVDGGELVMEHDAISYNYIKSWFLIDFVGSVPIDIIIDGFAQGVDGVVTGDAAQDVSLLQILRTGKYFKLIRMIRILRLAKLDRHVQQIEVLLRVNPSVMRIVRLIVWITIMAHISACVWFVVGGITAGTGVSWIDVFNKCTTDTRTCDLLSEPASYKYLVSIYWAFTTMTTVGYGDVTPVSVPEIIFAVIEMMGGAAMFAYIVGNMASLVDSVDARTKLYKEKMEAVQEFIHQRGIPNDLRHRIQVYYDYNFHRNDLFLEERILRELSTGLRSDVAMYIHKSFLDKVPFLAGRDKNFLSQLVMKLKPLHFRSKQIIYESGDTGHGMYFISKGRVAIRVKGKIITRLGVGCYFGEAAMLVDNERRTTDATAEDDVELFSLSKLALHECVAAFPEIARDLVEVACSRLVQLDSATKDMAIGWESDSDVSSDDDHPHPLGLMAHHGGASSGVGLSAPMNIRRHSTLVTGGERAPASGIVNLSGDDAGNKSITGGVTPEDPFSTGSVLSTTMKRRLSKVSSMDRSPSASPEHAPLVTSSRPPGIGVGHGAAHVAHRKETLCLSCPHCRHEMPIAFAPALPT